MKKQGFTLIELLAVIAILGIILAIAVPNIVGLIEKATKNAFLVDAKNVLRAVDYYLLDKEDVSSLKDLDVNSIENTLNIGSSNYSSFEVSFDQNFKPFIKIVGKNKWQGLMACGTFTNLQIGSDIDCEVPPFPAKLPGRHLCGSVFYDERDGNKYKTVKIGNQCWFGENLRYTGSGCLVNSIDDWKNESPYGVCMMYIEEEDYQGNDVPLWVKNEEVLYQWGAAMNGKLNPQTVEDRQGLCPSGWHIPSDYEWKVLEAYVDSKYKEVDEEDENNEWNDLGDGKYRGKDAGKNLKSANKDEWNDPSGAGTDFYGFMARPAGSRITSGILNNVGTTAYWWTSSSGEGSDAWRRGLVSDDDGVERGLNSQANGRAVRCIRD
ncbi:MAG: FISUMP domain-containing protein [Bacilli bacterium]